MQGESGILDGKQSWLRPGSKHRLGHTSAESDAARRMQYINRESVSRKHLLLGVAEFIPEKPFTHSYVSLAPQRKSRKPVPTSLKERRSAHRRRSKVGISQSSSDHERVNFRCPDYHCGRNPFFARQPRNAIWAPAPGRHDCTRTERRIHRSRSLTSSLPGFENATSPTLVWLHCILALVRKIP